MNEDEHPALSRRPQSELSVQRGNERLVAVEIGFVAHDEIGAGIAGRRRRPFDLAFGMRRRDRDRKLGVIDGAGPVAIEERAGRSSRSRVVATSTVWSTAPEQRRPPSLRNRSPAGRRRRPETRRRALSPELKRIARTIARAPKATRGPARERAIIRAAMSFTLGPRALAGLSYSGRLAIDSGITTRPFSEDR